MAYELKVSVLGLNYKCTVQLPTSSVCRDLIIETRRRYARDYPSAELPELHYVYKSPARQIRIRSREAISNVFKSGDHCYIGMKKTKCQNENSNAAAVCKYDFTVVFHTKDLGWKLVHDGTCYRIGKIASSKASAYFQRLIPGTMVTHLENERIDSFSPTELQEQFTRLTLPMRLGFKGSIPPSVPKTRSSITLYKFFPRVWRWIVL